VSTYIEGLDALAGCACSGTRNIAPVMAAATRGLQYAGRAGELPFIAMPGAQQARANEVLGEAARLEAALRTFAPPATSAPQFAAWAASWKSWHAQLANYINGINWFDKLWAATAEQIETYAGQLGAWQQQFRSFGGYLPGVLPPASSVWRTIGIGVAAGLITASIIYFVRRPSPGRTRWAEPLDLSEGKGRVGRPPIYTSNVGHAE